MSCQFSSPILVIVHGWKINQVNDIKKIPPEEYEQLAEEIRQFLITKISQTGGHLASNLGVVELTMALHLCFDFPKDKVVWDVGHQSYTHKLLTGRKSGFDELRKYGGKIKNDLWLGKWKQSAQC